MVDARRANARAVARLAMLEGLLRAVECSPDAPVAALLHGIFVEAAQQLGRDSRQARLVANDTTWAEFNQGRQDSRCRTGAANGATATGLRTRRHLRELLSTISSGASGASVATSGLCRVPRAYQPSLAGSPEDLVRAAGVWSEASVTGSNAPSAASQASSVTPSHPATASPASGSPAAQAPVAVPPVSHPGQRPPPVPRSQRTPSSVGSQPANPSVHHPGAAPPVSRPLRVVSSQEGVQGDDGDGTAGTQPSPPGAPHVFRVDTQLDPAGTAGTSPLPPGANPPSANPQGAPVAGASHQVAGSPSAPVAGATSQGTAPQGPHAQSAPSGAHAQSANIQGANPPAAAAASASSQPKSNPIGPDGNYKGKELNELNEAELWDLTRELTDEANGLHANKARPKNSTFSVGVIADASGNRRLVATSSLTTNKPASKRARAYLEANNVKYERTAPPMTRIKNGQFHHVIEIAPHKYQSIAVVDSDTDLSHHAERRMMNLAGPGEQVISQTPSQGCCEGCFLELRKPPVEKQPNGTEVVVGPAPITRVPPDRQLRDSDLQRLVRHPSRYPPPHPPIPPTHPIPLGPPGPKQG